MLTSTFADYSLVSKVDLMQIANLQTEQRTLHLASIKLDPYKAGLTASNQRLLITTTNIRMSLNSLLLLM